VGAVLIVEQDGLPGRADARPRARRLDLHQRNQAVDLGLLRRKLGQDTAETERFFTKGGPHPVVTGGRCVALIENEIDDREHG